jgi:glycosyltransferase involved in cell wall biosynthesis
MISVIIPSYNRYDSLLFAIQSVKNQTYKDIEIIVVNDCSTDSRYYQKISGCTTVNLEKNSRIALNIKKNPYGGRARNYGLKIANGNYIAFLDDDDYWMPKKIETQMEFMEKTNTCFSCTEGLYGTEQFNKDKKYPLYNKEKYWEFLSKKLNLTDNLPNIIDEKLLIKHNVIINSSVIIKKTIYDNIGNMKEGCFAEDYDYWKKCIKYSNCCYVPEPMVYYSGKK